MTQETIAQIMQDIFRDIFDQPSLVITRETSAKDIEDWDSLSHVNIVVAAEKAFKVTFALGELKSLNNVGDMYDLIQKKLSHA